MVRHGFPVKGLEFNWDDPVDYTPEQQLAFETLVVNNYEVPGSYFEDKYGIPAGERKSAPSEPSKPAEKGEKQQDAAPFFD